MGGSALTDKQADLAVKLVNKYTRQLAAHGIDTAGITPPKYRRPLRIIDRTQAVELDDGVIRIRFPYNQKLIDHFRELSKESQGKVIFDRDKKTWNLALTEYNVNWAVEFARQHSFAVDAVIAQWMAEIVKCEEQDYRIELRKTDIGYEIINAAGSLNTYVEEKLGGFGLDNLPALIDHAPILGYSVPETLIQELMGTYGIKDPLLFTHREHNLNNDPIARVIAYASITNRWPVVVFNPTGMDTIDEWASYFQPEEVLVVKNQRKDFEPDPMHRLIYTHKGLKSLNRIPLLVSQVGMIAGSDKQLMVSRAEKIFYASQKLSP
jgi:hypothetical protein